MKIQSYFFSAALPAVAGLILGELLMARMFVIFQPILGAMTFLTVEVMGAFLIDFPMAFVSAFILTKTHPHAKSWHAILSGVVFAITFTLFIGLVMVIHQFTDSLDIYGLYQAISLAARTAREELGNFYPVMIMTFLAFEFLICMTAGMIGHILAVANRRSENAAVPQ